MQPRLLALLLLASSAEAQTTLGAHGQPVLEQRVASGDVTPFSALLWTRANAFGPVLWEVSTDPTFHSGALKRWGLAWGANVPAKRTVFPLQPGTRYHYRATDLFGATDQGAFSTPALTGHRGLHFGVSGDARGDLMPFRSVATAASAELDFFVHLGDTIYADVESPALPGVDQATTLDQYRLKQREVVSAVDGINGLGDLRASTAFWTTIDDHEVTNDFAGGADPSTDDRFDDTGDYINETQLYRRGLRAFVDYHPSYPLYWGWTGDARTTFKRKLYRWMHYGQDAALFLLDARSFRDQELPDADPSDPASVAQFLVDAFDPARTMLGEAQVQALLDDLLTAEQAGVTWKLVLVPEPIQNLGVVAAADRFEGYAYERSRILRFVAEHGLRNVVFVSADIHGSLVNELTYQPGPFQEQLATGAFEITTGPIAYDAPFGPTVVELALAFGLIGPDEKALYDSLPLPGKEAFVGGLIDALLAPLGYSLLGLQDASDLDVELLEGGYLATHTYGWTEFEIDAETQDLTVTTHGILPDDPIATPLVLGRFRVHPR